MHGHMNVKVLFSIRDTAQILVFMHFVTKNLTKLHEEMLIVVPLLLHCTTGLDFDKDLVGFLNSSKFDLNRIMLLTIDGKPAMFSTKKKRYFSVSRIYKFPPLDTSVRTVLKVLLILSDRTPFFTTGNTKCFWKKPVLRVIICCFIMPYGGWTNSRSQ
jgi:hypothetical protein